MSQSVPRGAIFSSSRAIVGLALTAWFILIAVSFLVEWRQDRRFVLDSAMIEARSSYNKDLLYRRWATLHGGVYVPPTESTPPNPYLSKIPDRDVITTDGKPLTLLNPAYMTRQVHELGEQQYGTKGHITSLNPLRPENAPDEWERAALQAFETGSSEVISIEVIGDQTFLRFMRPMITEPGCLKCHGEQGYREGEIRGGISVSVPFAPYDQIQKRNLLFNLGAHGLIGILGFLGIWMGGTAIVNSQAKLRENRRQLELALFGGDLGMWDWDIPSDRFELNQRWAEMLGYRLDELDKTSGGLAELFHPDDLACRKQALEDHLSGRTEFFESEHRLRHRNGDWIWLLDRGRVVERGSSGQATRLCGTSLNITDRKKAEGELRLRSLVLDQIQDLVTVTDLNGVVSYVNEAECRALGQSPAELIGKPVSVYGDDPGRGATQTEIISETLHSGYWRGEIVNRTASGDDLTMDCRAQLIRDETGEAVALCGIATDVTERRRLQNALEEKLAQLTVMLDSMQLGVLVEDMERSILFANREFVRIFDAVVLAPAHLSMASGPEFWELAAGLFSEPSGYLADVGRRVQDGRVVIGERLEKLDGQILERTYAPIHRDGLRFGHLWIYADKTEQVRVEREYRTLFHEMQDGLAIHEVLCDEDGIPVDYRWLDTNPAFEHLTGLDRRVIGKTARAVYPDLAEDLVELYGRVALTGEPVDFERYDPALDKYFEVRVFCPAPRQFATILSDVTIRRQAEQQRLRLNLAIEQIEESVVITDSSWSIEYVNPAFESVTGYQADEVIGRSLLTLSGANEAGGVYDQVIDTLARGESWSGRLTSRKKDGGVVTEQATISPVRNEAGDFVNFVAAKRDISLQLETEEQLHQYQRVEAVGRLAGGVAHDLNNLLAPILGFSEMLMDEGTDGEQKEFATEIHRAGVRARDLVQHLLAFSRKQKLNVASVDLGNILENFSGLLKRTVPEDVVIRTDVPPELPSVLVDVGQIERVIMNLVVNAADAMPRGGLVTIAATLAQVEEADAGRADVKPGLYVQMTVSDTGQGMNEEVRKRIFEPFFSTKGDRGTGMGLATVFGIVKQHGGHIDVESSPGIGTTFRVLLPAEEKGVGEVKIGVRPPKPLPGPETILLVEDNDQLRNMANVILRKQGYSVLAARNGLDALAILDSHQGPVHLLLTDVVMPIMNGRELYQKVSQRLPGLKVLYMSGYPNEVIGRRGVLEDDFQLVQKPFSVHTLTSRVRDILDKV